MIEPHVSHICGACKYWREMRERVLDDGDRLGQCRRYAPRYESPGDGWPKTWSGQECGEWRRHVSGPRTADEMTKESCDRYGL